MKIFGVVLVAVVLVLSGCSKDSQVDPVDLAPSSLERVLETAGLRFEYTGFDRRGATIVRGHLELFRSGSGEIVGRWALRSVGDPGRIGPQVGTGVLTGELNDGLLGINLNPRFVDNNVELMGRLNRTTYSGRWQWIGFPGILNSGTFRAEMTGRPVESTN